jgi:hypothetical protein
VNLLSALKISSVGKAVRTPFTFNEPKEVEINAKGAGSILMHTKPGDFSMMWPYFFSDGQIPPKSQALLYDDWTAVEPGEVIDALGKML